MTVIKRKLRYNRSNTIHNVTQVGISSNTGSESKKLFIADALADYRRARGIAATLRLMGEVRHGK